jgi:hypothetical protein
MWNIGLRAKTVNIVIHRRLDVALAELELELEQAHEVSRPRRTGELRSVR